MSKRTKRLAIFIVIVAVVIGGAIVIFRIQSEKIALGIGDIVTAKFGRDRNIRIEASDISGSVFRGLYLKDVRVTYTGGDMPRILLSAASIYVRYDLTSLLTGNKKIDSIEVVSPRVVIPMGPDGRRVYLLGDTKPGPPGKSSDIRIRGIKLSDVSVLLEARSPWVIKSMALNASYAKEGDVSTLTIKNADLSYGQAARIDYFSGVIRSMSDRVEIHDARIRTPSTSLGLSGFFGIGRNDSLAVDASVDSLDVAEIPALYGKERASTVGSIRGHVLAAGSLKRMALELDLAGTVNGMAVDSLKASGVYADSAITIKGLSCILNGSPFGLRGEVVLSTPPEFGGVVTFTNLDLSRFVRAEKQAYSCDLDGSIRFSGRGFDKASLNVTAWPDLARGRYRDWGFDSVTGQLRVTPTEVALDTMFAALSETEVSAAGRMGFDGDLDLGFALNCPRLEDLYAYHKVKGLAGEVTATAGLKMNKANLTFSAKSLGRGIDYAGAYLESLLVDVSLTQAGGHRRGNVAVLATSLNLRGFKAGELVGDAAIEDTSVRIDRLAITRPEGDLAGARGEVRISKGTYVIGIDNMFMEMADYTWYNSDPIEVVYAHDSLSVSSFEMASEMGAVSFSNSSFQGGRYRLDTRISNLDLGLLKKVVGKEIPTGILSLAFDLSGSPNDLRFDLDFAIKQGEMHSVKFKALSGALAYGDKNLAIKQISLEENGGNVFIDGTIPVDLSPARLEELSKAGKTAEIIDDLGGVSVKARNMDISVFWPLAPPLTKVKGLADLDLNLSGRRENPRITSQGTLREAVYSKTPIGDVSWDLVLEDSTLRVASLDLVRDKEKVKIAGDMPLAVTVFPFVSSFPGRSMDLTVEAEDGNLDLLCEILPRLKVCSGTYGANLAIGGTFEDPTFTGHVNLAGAHFRFEGVPQDVQDVYLEAEAKGKRFEVTKMVAENGALKAQGFFALDGVKVSDWDFALALKHLAISEFEDFYVILSGDMAVKAESIEYVGVVPRIEGNLNVEEGEYYYSAAQVSGGGGGGMGPEAAPTWTINVGVEIPHHFWVKGDFIDAELQGSLNVRKGAEGLLVLGMLRTLRGTLYIYNNDLRITRGEFRFTDVKSLKNVYIDLEATSRVLDERVQIAAKGSMDNLDVTATSESGWSETQIFEALTLRRGMQTEGEPKGTFFANEFLRSWGVALVNRFGNEVARELRLDQFGVEVGDVGQGNVLSATRVTFGKYVSDKVYLQYTQALGGLYGATGKLTQRGLAFPERQFQVEYRLSDRFSMEGEAGTVGGLGYFDVDLKFTYGY